MVMVQSYVATNTLVEGRCFLMQQMDAQSAAAQLARLSMHGVTLYSLITNRSPRF